MARRKVSRHRVFDERARAFLEDFAKEAPDVRNSIVNDLPAYNALLSINAQTFEEFALQWWATKQSINGASEKAPLPECPKCNSVEHVGTKGKKLYRCNSCNCSFAANYNSISSGMKTDALTWMKVLRCMLEYMGMAKTCEYCNITNTTYYNIRNRLFYAMSVLLEDVRLYGVIEVDNTFVRSSYKGMSLKESEFEEDSIFFDPTHKPREARRRGGAYSFVDRTANSICIFTAIDDTGHVLTRFAGIGAANYASLIHYIPDGKYLLNVPKADPFPYLKKQTKEQISSPKEASLMVADKERAIEKYAGKIGIDIEAHVFRRNGKQIRLPEYKHNIQRVNALHKRLKEFLSKHNHVSTKYLPGYLTLFEFIENTGASDAAIRKLFQILATPNSDRPSKFFDELFAVPNYLEEWLIGDNPLSKFAYSKLLGFYMYDCLKNGEDFQGKSLVMRDIEDETGYTDRTIRKHYREFNDAGYRDLILSYFNKNVKKKEQEVRKKNKFEAPKTLNPIVLAIYDEYAAMRKLPKKDRITFGKFVEEKNRQYGTDFGRTNLYEKFKYIAKLGIRERIEKTPYRTERYGVKVQQLAPLILEDYDKLVLSYREKGEPVPRKDILTETLGKKYGLSMHTVTGYLSFARAEKRRKKQMELEKEIDINK